MIANVGCRYFWPDQPAEPPSPVSPAEPYLFRPEFLAVLRIPISVANTGACGVSWRCDGKGLIADLDETPRSPDRSNLREAAVDEEFIPVDEATVVGSEENDGFCHLIRSA